MYIVCTCASPGDSWLFAKLSDLFLHFEKSLVMLQQLHKSWERDACSHEEYNLMLRSTRADFSSIKEVAEL